MRIFPSPPLRRARARTADRRLAPPIQYHPQTHEHRVTSTTTHHTRRPSQRARPRRATRPAPVLRLQDSKSSTSSIYGWSPAQPEHHRSLIDSNGNLPTANSQGGEIYFDPSLFFSPY